MRSSILAAVVFGVGAAGCGFAPPIDEERMMEVAAAVEAGHAAFLDAARRADAEAIADAMTTDGLFLLDGNYMTSPQGSEVIRQMYAPLAQMRVDIAEETVEVLGPDAAMVAGTATVTQVDGEGVDLPPVVLAYTFIWTRQEDGIWKIVHSHQSVAEDGVDG